MPVCTSEGHKHAESYPYRPGTDSLVCGLQRATHIMPVPMTKAGKTALNNKSLERKFLLPKPLRAKMVARNPQDMWRELNLTSGFWGWPTRGLGVSSFLAMGLGIIQNKSVEPSLSLPHPPMLRSNGEELHIQRLSISSILAGSDKEVLKTKYITGQHLNC